MLHQSTRKEAESTSFTFVNQDARQFGVKPDRRKINSHTAAIVRRRRRRDEVKSFQDKIALVRDIDDTTQGSSSDSRDSSGRSYDTQGGTYASSKVSQRPQQDRSQLFKGPTIQPSHSSPLTLLRKGNSDPFATFPVDFNPAVAHVLRLSDQILLSVLFAAELRFEPNPLSVTRSRQGIIHQLHDPCSANAFLSYSVMALAGMTGTIQASYPMMDFALVCRSRTLKLLQHRLSAKGYLTDMRMLEVIFLLFASAISENNQEVAGMHARILCESIRARPGGFVMLDPLFKEKVITSDVGKAANTLTRPIFDIAEWYPQLDSLLDREVALGPIEETLANRLEIPVDSSIRDDELRNIFSGLRETAEVEGLLFEGMIRPSFAFFRWMTSRKLAGQSGILQQHANFTGNIRFDTNNELDQKTKSNESNTQCNFAQITACVAALYWTYVLFTNHASHGVFLNNLRRSIEAWDLAIEEQSTARHSNPELRLWALYMGATGEQIFHAMAPEKEWHNVHLATQAMAMGLNSWKQVVKVLQSFLYVERMKPNGEEWFEKTLREHEMRKRKNENNDSGDLGT